MATWVRIPALYSITFYYTYTGYISYKASSIINLNTYTIHEDTPKKSQKTPNYHQIGSVNCLLDFQCLGTIGRHEFDKDLLCQGIPFPFLEYLPLQNKLN